MDEKEYQRKCPNWIQTFKDWTLPRTEVSEKFIIWTAVWTLAATLRRRVFIGKKYLGGWTCYPYLYIMFVAPPGMRKTSTIAFSIDLMEKLPNFPPSPTLITQSSLVEEITKSPDHSIYLTMEEFGDLIIKGGKEMFEFLTSMYDGKKSLRQNTRMRGLEYAEKPTINLLAGTTPEWITDNIPRALIGGGFASRVVWVYENKLRQKALFYNPKVTEIISKYEEPLTADLIHIAQLEGEFEINDDAVAYAEAWYRDIEKKYKGYKFAGYVNRKHVMVLKLAQILHIAYSDELVVTLEDIKNAIILLESVEPNLEKVFTGVGKNEYALDMNDIVEYIKQEKRVEDKVLRRHFQTSAAPTKLEELISGLLIAGYIKTDTEFVDVDGKKVTTIYYTPTEI